MIGLYPRLVREREALSAPKWLATLPAAAHALGRMRHHRLRICRPGEDRVPVVTPMMFVGNGRYRLEAGVSAGRESLEDGSLSLYAVASRRRLALIGFALRAVMGRADPEGDFAALGDHPGLRSRAARAGSKLRWMGRWCGLRCRFASSVRRGRSPSSRAPREVRPGRPLEQRGRFH